MPIAFICTILICTMIERSIIAQNITNLTDARYFAAWGVEYVSFNAIPESEHYLQPEKIKEIKDWLEGPKTLIETNSLEFDELADGLILSTIYSSLPMSKECFYRASFEDLEKSLPEGHYIIKINSSDQLKKLNQLPENHLLGLHLYLDITDIKLEDTSLLGDYGLAIQGGEEEQPGVKSFDELDDLYDLLMD